MTCWHQPDTEYNTCWRCDYARDYYGRLRISWTLTFVVVALFLTLSWLS